MRYSVPSFLLVPDIQTGDLIALIPSRLVHEVGAVSTSNEREFEGSKTVGSGYRGLLRPGAGSVDRTLSISSRHKSNSALTTTVTMGPLELPGFDAM